MNIDNLIIKQIKNTYFDKQIMAGPCSFTSYEEIYNIAKKLKELGINYIRGGSFKPRTSPYSFQGLREDGIKIIKQVKKELDVKFVCELLSETQVEKFANDIDIIQIGSRNMYNYELLKSVGKLNKPVILKRGMCATLEEWLMSAEYIAKEGNTQIILCERGIRSFDKETRNVLDLQAVSLLKKELSLPIIVDPSHASGRRDIVVDMSKASLICNADGLLLETHIEPEKSISDSKQTISINELAEIKQFFDKKIA